MLNDETDEIYEFNDHGDLVELRHASNYHYSIHDSFVVFDEVKNIYEKIYDANFEEKFGPVLMVRSCKRWRTEKEICLRRMFVLGFR